MGAYIECPRCGGRLELEVHHERKIQQCTNTGLKYYIYPTSYHCYECDLTQ
jgi:hypothetical protein